MKQALTDSVSIQPFFFTSMKEENLYGLVIAGGESNRMGSDKAWLRYHGKPQLYHVFDQLSACTDQVFISCNKFQKNRIFPYYQTIVDKKAFENKGPIAALLTAFNQLPGRDFLVIATDYPFLNTCTLSKFAAVADQHQLSAFYNAEAKVYEPLLAYYPKEIYPALKAFYEEGNYSLQQFLAEHKAVKFFPSDENEITNVNTPEEYEAAYHKINGSRYLHQHSNLSAHG